MSSFREDLGPLSTNDPSSFSNPDAVIVKHIKLRWTVDFDRRVLKGSATYTLQQLQPEAEYLILDTRQLEIISVNWPKDGRTLDFDLPNVPEDLIEDTISFGRPLRIRLPPPPLMDPKDPKKQNQDPMSYRLSIMIEFETSPECTGLQWLNPEQTSSLKFPVVYSQAQDTPSVRFTFAAEVPLQTTIIIQAFENILIELNDIFSQLTIKIVAPKQLTVLMSGLRAESPELINGTQRRHKFEQSKPIPSFLLSIVVGRFERRSIGPRTFILAEEEWIDLAVKDFSGVVDKYFTAAEALAGKYIWEDFNILVLPPTFPFGVMENPSLALLSTTLLTSEDGSLADVIAHVLAHSWTGNMVSPMTFEHFWLIEGLTVFLERKILGVVRGEPYRQFVSIGVWQDLIDAIALMSPSHQPTSLVINLQGRHPDEVLSLVPYEKGYIFLFFLEEKVGGPAIFEPYLKDYIQSFSLKSIDSTNFKDHFIQYFTKVGKGSQIADIDWKTWLYGSGLPPYTPTYDKSLATPSNDLKVKWNNWTEPTKDKPSPYGPKDLEPFKVKGPQLLDFILNILYEAGPNELRKVQALQQAYDFNSIKNSEIRFLWLRLCVKVRWKEQLPLVYDFITSTHRLKFIRPLYRDLFNWPEVREETIQVFEGDRPRMVSHVIYEIEQALDLPPTIPLTQLRRSSFARKPVTRRSIVYPFNY